MYGKHTKIVRIDDNTYQQRTMDWRVCRSRFLPPDGRSVGADYLIMPAPFFADMVEDRTVASPNEGQASAAACIQVALIGGAHLYRTALRYLIASEPLFEIVAEGNSIDDVVAHTTALHADVVLLDIDDASIDRLDTVERVKSSIVGAAILLLVGDIETPIVDRLVLAGARGVVFKNVAENHLHSAIRKVHDGEVWIDRAAASRLITAFSNRGRAISGAERARIDSLSRRELEVVTLVADGLCNKAIAKKMSISDNTVRHHLTSIYAKLETRDRLELVIYALRQGVVRPPG